VAVLEAARVLAKYGGLFERTIRFALWGVEEIGLIGSTQYVAKHEAELDRLRFYLNMDGAGSIPKMGIVLNEWPELESILAEWSKEMALPFGVKQSVSAFSDHYPFLLAGVPTGSIGNFEKGRSGRGYGHTRYDTLDKVDIRGLREAAVLAARLSLRIANMVEWPVSRRDAEAVKTAVDNPDNQETAAFFATLDEHYRQVLAEKGTGD
jgi:Zn-dependent M28 family amino/carboxypeptidase